MATSQRHDQDRLRDPDDWAGVPSVDVLVVGAGPTGLALALQAAVLGAHVVVVERRTEAFRPSRAMILHPRTLEVLRPLGVTSALLQRSAASPEIRLHVGHRQVPVRLDALGVRGTPFPYPVLIRQSDVETVLAAALVDRDVQVERGVELMGFSEGSDHIAARLSRGSTSTVLRCRFLAGCDGARSTVRHHLGLGWRGGSYRSEVVLADVELAESTPAVAHLIGRREGLLFVFPLGEYAPWRLLATRPRTAPNLPLGALGPPVPQETVRELVAAAGLASAATTVAWSTRVQLPHRLADRFRDGRVFLAGDAAHAHSPAGGQGMNTGLQDAVNLGWKLAAASRGSASVESAEALLTSYEIERRPVARRMLALTRLLFWFEAGSGALPAFLRGRLAAAGAPLLPALVRGRWLGAPAMWLLAQFFVRYRRSPLSVEESRCRRGPRAGDRVPDQEVSNRTGRHFLHDLLADPGVHLLLDRDAAEPDPAWFGPNVAVHRLTDRAGTGIRGVRPDGYLGYRASVLGPGLWRWLGLVGAGAESSADRPEAADAPADSRSAVPLGASAPKSTAGSSARERFQVACGEEDFRPCRLDQSDGHDGCRD